MKDIAVVDFNTLQKQNKRGFTLVELVVTIAILAILCGIAIPIVAYRLDQTVKNSAISNARTIEYAIKEAQAAQAAEDTTIYPNVKTTPITISEVATRKAIKDAFAPVKYKGVEYKPAWSDGRVYFVTGSTTIDGATLTSKTDISATSSLAVSTL